jgi:hypothetical protein
MSYIDFEYQIVICVSIICNLVTSAIIFSKFLLCDVRTLYS